MCINLLSIIVNLVVIIAKDIQQKLNQFQSGMSEWDIIKPGRHQTELSDFFTNIYTPYLSSL